MMKLFRLKRGVNDILATSLVSLLLALVLSPQIFAQPSLQEKLQQFCTHLDSNNAFMGSFALMKNGKTLYTNAIGIRALTPQRLLSNIETKYRIGSITKTFTAVMIMQLIEDGKLTLSTPLSSFFPTLPNAKSITIADLLSHRSGLFNFTSDKEFLKTRTKAVTQKQMLAMFARQKPTFKPNTQSAYSNTNYVLLGYILEKITSATYSNVLQKQICIPIGLQHTYVGRFPDDATNEAHSFQRLDSSWVEEPSTDMSVPQGAGAIISTASDIATFLESLFAGKLVSQASLELMKKQNEGSGMGLFTFPFGKRVAYGHTGGIDAFHSLVGHFPNDSLTVCIISNGGNHDINDVAIGVMSAAFNVPFSHPVFSRSLAYTTTKQERMLIEGKYSSPDFPLVVNIYSKDHNVIAQATGQQPLQLTATSATEFRFDKAAIVMKFAPLENSLVLTQQGRSILLKRTP